MIRKNKTHSRNQTFISLGIFATLIAIGTGIILAQFRSNPAILKKEVLSPPAKIDAVPALVAANESFVPLPQKLVPFTIAETFDARNLSDKIDGKAELYLSAGFTRLTSQRFKDKKEADLWIEAYIYDMGTGQNAFSVFSAQRRDDAEKLDLGRYSYKTPNAVFLVHGHYYVELIASQTSQQSLQTMEMLAQTFMGNTRTKSATIDEMKLFPSQHLVADSITLISSDAFGYDGLDKVYTAEYQVGGGSLMAYLSRRRTFQEAGDLATAYRDFLTAFGGQNLDASLPIKNAQVVEILETYEIIFSIGPFLAGIRESDDKQKAINLASSLYNRISKHTGDR